MIYHNHYSGCYVKKISVLFLSPKPGYVNTLHNLSKLVILNFRLA